METTIDVPVSNGSAWLLLLFVSASALVGLSQLMDYQVLGQCYPGHTPLTQASARYVLLGVKSRVE